MDDANLLVGDDNVNSLRSVLGARFANTWISAQGAQIDGRLGLAWTREFEDQSAFIDSAFAANSDVVFRVDGLQTETDRFQATFGVGVSLSQTTRLDLDYSGEFAAMSGSMPCRPCSGCCGNLLATARYPV